MLISPPFPYSSTPDADRIRVRRGVTPDGRSLMAYGGDSLYVACVADCFAPVFYVVRASSWEDAYDLALGDRTVPAHKCRDHLTDDRYACHPERGDHVDGVTWSDDRGDYVDDENVMVWGPIA